MKKSHLYLVWMNVLKFGLWSVYLECSMFSTQNTWWSSSWWIIQSLQGYWKQHRTSKSHIEIKRNQVEKQAKLNVNDISI